MAIKKFKPTTPSRRFMTVSTFDEVTTTTPERSLLVSKNKSGGRNANGRITVRHIGGGNRECQRENTNKQETQFHKHQKFFHIPSIKSMAQLFFFHTFVN